MTKIKSASFTRYTKVQKLLQTDPLLKKELSKEMVAICRPDQTSQDFQKEVVYVVDKIHAKGLDANTCTSKDILKFAFELLVTNKGPIVIAPTPEAPVPAKQPARKKAVGAKQQTTLPPAEEPDEPVPAKAKAAPAPKSKAASAAPPPVVAKNNEGVGNSAVEKTIKVVAIIRPGIPNVISCAALANLQAALSLLEAVAADADAKDVCQRLNTLIDDIHRRTIIPSAKENTETTAG